MNRFITLIILAIAWDCTSCEVKPVENLPPQRQMSGIPTPQPTSTQQACDPNEQPEKIQLQYPTDLAVTRDGETVYALSGSCLSIRAFKEVKCDEEQIQKEIIPSRFIYKISSTQSIQILKIKNKFPLACEIPLKSNIESDNKDNLYLTDSRNSDIYKIEPDQDRLSLLTHVPETVSGWAFSTPDPPELPNKSGPFSLYVNDNQVYYEMSENLNDIKRMEVKRLESNGKPTTLFSSGNFSTSHPILFAVHQNIFGWIRSQ